MPCERPLRLLNPRYKDCTDEYIAELSERRYGCKDPPDLYIDVPCGYCHSCQKRRSNDWRIRLMHENTQSDRSLFITLTFDDDHIQEFYDEQNKPVLRWLDLLRKKFGKGLRHWFACEFGTLHGRPHYHGIIFNAPPTLTAHVIEKSWKRGFVFIGYCNEKTISYVVKYVTKPYTKDKIAPRIIVSKGLGKSYITVERVACHHYPTLRPYLTVNGFTMALPRYYKDRIFTEEDKIQMILDNANRRTFTYNGKEFSNYLAMDRYRRQHFAEQVRNGFTPRYRPPTNKRKHKKSKLQTINIPF